MPRHPDNTTVICNPAWAPIVEQVQRQGNARNLPRPAGYENVRGRGTGYAFQRSCLADGGVRGHLFFRTCDGHYVHIGSFTPQSGALPGETTAGRVINLACGRQVRVEIDARGLPYPVPVEITR